MLRIALVWLRAQVERAQLKYLWQTATIAVLASTAAFGGLATAPAIRMASLGDEVSIGPLRITPHALVVGCSEEKVPRGAALDIRDGQSLVVLRATIESAADEDVSFGSGDSTRVFKLQSEPRYAYLGVYPEDAKYYVSDIAARSTMDVSIIWRIPTVQANEMSTVTIFIYDLEKQQSLLLPSMDWGITVRHTGSQLSVPMTRC
ncbi:hypothetical protein FZI91_03405 [Mycobacterium sp. CBMA271]|uniref:hypothetical protein n=1 Tax=unclassified Mycobacteroides TaxID=2618759 RepID=UPI0012DE2096|nr:MULTISPECIES: hypothetical protein [unclassified Mycobacteroides]MUM18167.1 hypothetical protein [Mycobacteroides sp. CBMA 326]MUM20753.1 hypothetical protein [Mycobacteroides sp. CBMA 271]